MARNYCTLFDKNYLTKGMVMYHSLQKHTSEPFILWVLALDDETFDYLISLNNPILKPVYLGHFESLKGLDVVRTNRTWQEYCWTLASQFSLHLLLNLPSITYLDADLMFFSDPKPIFEEIGSKSIGIIPHRFAEADRARLEPNGKFNVSWVTFNKDGVSLRCASTWAKQCIQWCYNKVEDGRMGDQRYLDDWPNWYGEHLCIILNPGAGLAPWNIKNHIVEVEDESSYIEVWTKELRKWHRLIFYHYHEFSAELQPDRQYKITLTNYPLRSEDKALIYEPYLDAYINVDSSRPRNG